MWAETAYTDRIALVGPTAADVRDVMIEGESGIMAISPRWMRPQFLPSKRKLVWPNGVQAFTYSAEEPERLRGPQHGAAWCDEAMAWKYPETMDMLDMGLRLGKYPRKVVTSTPKQNKMLKALMKAADTVITRGSTFDNAANLPAAWLEGIKNKYENTRLGRQELYAEMLTDNEGALWTRAILDEFRLARADSPEAFDNIAVAVDPTVSATGNGDECGIVIGGTTGYSSDVYILEDASFRASPEQWARRAIGMYHKYRADMIIAEENNGGELVRMAIQQVDPMVPVRLVHASRGKYARAEPISMLYEQGRVHHIGFFAELEDQMCEWTREAKYSPDRMDALVWLCTHLAPRTVIDREPFVHEETEVSAAISNDHNIFPSNGNGSPWQ